MYLEIQNHEEANKTTRRLLTIIEPPTISSVPPSLVYGAVITVTGNNFFGVGQSAPGAYGVQVWLEDSSGNTQTVPATIDSLTQLHFTMPATAAGPVQIRVVNRDTAAFDEGSGNVGGVPPTATFTPTDTPTRTPTHTPTATPTSTATNTPVPPTDTPTDTPTSTPTNTPVPPTDTPTETPTSTATDTPGGPTDTPTDTPTETPTQTDTPTQTPTATATNTSVPCNIGNLGSPNVDACSFCSVAGVSADFTADNCNGGNVCVPQMGPWMPDEFRFNVACVLAPTPTPTETATATATDTPTQTPTPVPTPMHRIFTTSGSWAGAAVGGIVGADAKCNAEASSAGLGGTWRAVLSTSSIDARDHVSIVGPVFNLRPSGSGGPQ